MKSHIPHFNREYMFYLFICLLFLVVFLSNYVAENYDEKSKECSLYSVVGKPAKEIPQKLEQLQNQYFIRKTDRGKPGNEISKKEEQYQNQYLIQNTDRFLWYQQKRQGYLSHNEKNRAWMKLNISLLKVYNAYEFEFEYSVSHLTPKVNGADVYCRYFDRNNKEIGHPVKSFTYPEYIVNCPKKDGTKKISISMTNNGSYDKPVSLIDRKQKDLKYKLSMCLSPIYGNEPKWLMFIELVEHYKIQGVDHFYIYVNKIDNYSNSAVNEYVKSGHAEVVQITDYMERDPAELQIMMYKDCTLRSRGESRWSIFADIDERLTMTKYNGTLLDYVNNITDQSIGSIVFRQRWIMKTASLPEKYEGKQQILDWMPTRRWQNTSSVGPILHTTKCIIDTKKVFSMWIHYPEMMFPGYKSYDLKPEEGVVRHYRDLALGSWGTIWLKGVEKFGPFELTKYPEHLMDQLTNNVQNRVANIYGETT